MTTWRLLLIRHSRHSAHYILLWMNEWMNEPVSTLGLYNRSTRWPANIGLLKTSWIPWIRKRCFSSLDTMMSRPRHRRCTAANQSLATLLLQGTQDSQWANLMLHFCHISISILCDLTVLKHCHALHCPYKEFLCPRRLCASQPAAGHYVFTLSVLLSVPMSVACEPSWP